MGDTHYTAAIAAFSDTDLSKGQQKQTGQVLGGDMHNDYKQFADLLFKLIDTGEIDVYDQDTFLKYDIYEKLDEDWREKVDISLANIANQIRLIDEVRKAVGPTESPQLQTMILHLLEMKNRIEVDDDHDVFKF